MMAVGAAAGFGLLQFAISGGSAFSTVMTMVVMRCASIPVLAIITVVSLRTRRPGETRFPTAIWVLVIVVGVLDVSANLLFAQASVSGALAVVAVLGSLYPAATVLLARVVDHERLSKVQNVGVLAAIMGVAMIAAGS